MATQSVDELLHRIQELTDRLEETEQALHALRAGEVDAVVVESGDGRVYTLETADTPYRLIVERMPHAAATLTTDGEIIHCNGRFADLLQRPLASLPGQTVGNFVTPGSRLAMVRLLREGCAGEVQADISLQRADGSSIAAFLGACALQEGALGTCLVLTDMTEQRNYVELQRTQAALRESEQKFDTALASIQDYVYILDREARFVYANRVLLDQWGVTREKAVGRTMAELDYEKSVEVELLRNLRDVFATGQPVTSVTHYTSPTGVSGSFENVLAPVSDARGEVSLVVGVSRDITERLRVETMLRDADRRKDLFLATLAHELRNPLAPIRNAVQILKAKGSPDPELAWARDVIDRQVRLMARLLEDLLDVSRISRNSLDLRRERIDLAAVLAAALETSLPVIDAGHHELTLALPDEPIALEGDPVRLAQAFANLLNNAGKYTDDGGRISISAAREADTVSVSIQDNGIGISPETLPASSKSSPSRTAPSGGVRAGLASACRSSRDWSSCMAAALKRSAQARAMGASSSCACPSAPRQPACNRSAPPNCPPCPPRSAAS